MDNLIFGLIFLSFLLNLIVFIILVWPYLGTKKTEPNIPVNRRVKSKYGDGRLSWPAPPPYRGPLPGPRGPMMPNPWPDPKPAVPNKPTKKDQSSE